MKAALRAESPVPVHQNDFRDFKIIVIYSHNCSDANRQYQLPARCKSVNEKQRKNDRILTLHSIGAKR